jgi:oligopeptide transport system substrate-binding protein
MTTRAKLSVGAMFLLIFVAMVVAGCGPAATPVAPTPTPAAATPVPATATPAPPPTATVPPEPSVFRSAIPSEPASLEPGLAAELMTMWMGKNVHAGLLMYDAENNVVPYIAKSWEISGDGKTYTFHLRDDVYFHNGRKVVASDFKYCWERYLDPDVASAQGPEYLGVVAGAQDVIDGKTEDLVGVETPDDYTLVVHLTEVKPTFLLKLATPATWVVPKEAVVHDAPEWAGDPVGAGPFRFAGHELNVKWVFEANPDFFLGPPSVDRIEYYIVPDISTQLAMYETGELHVASVYATDLPRLQADPTLSKELNYYARAQISYVGMNQETFEPFKDVRVRKAFNYALDKDQIIEEVQFNAVIRAEGMIAPGIPGFNPDFKGYEYDPEKARALLAEAGYPDGQGFPPLLLTAYGATGLALAEPIQALLHENLGVGIEVNTAERGDMISGLWAHDKWDFFYFGWTADMLSPEVWLYEMLYCDTGSNFSNYCNPEVDAMIDEALVTVDDAERAARWQEVEEKAILEDAAMIPYAWTTYIYLVKPYVDGFRCNIIGPDWFKDVTISR